MTLEEIDAKPYHVGRMTRRLREGHANIITAAGIDLHREMRAAYEASHIRKAYLVDGDLAAIVGVTGTLLCSEGGIWLAITDDVSKRHPIVVARAALRFVDKMLASGKRLVCDVIENDHPAIAMAYFLGFSVQNRVAENGVRMIHMATENRRAA